MDYNAFAQELTVGRNLTQLGNLERVDRTLQKYFRVVNGERLTVTDMSRVTEGFWAAYESGWETAMTNAINIVSRTKQNII